jgi:TPP-dependent pyruvate/acetoin dehydrogenase alpha subunit
VGHHEGDPVIGIYRTQEEVDAWAQRCPITSFKRRILEDYAIVTGREIDDIDAAVDQAVEEAIEYARRSPSRSPRPMRSTSSPSAQSTGRARSNAARPASGRNQLARCGPGRDRRGDAA